MSFQTVTAQGIRREWAMVMKASRTGCNQRTSTKAIFWSNTHLRVTRARQAGHATQTPYNNVNKGAPFYWRIHPESDNTGRVRAHQCSAYDSSRPARTSSESSSSDADYEGTYSTSCQPGAAQPWLRGPGSEGPDNTYDKTGSRQRGHRPSIFWIAIWHVLRGFPSGTDRRIPVGA